MGLTTGSPTPAGCATGRLALILGTVGMVARAGGWVGLAVAALLLLCAGAPAALATKTAEDFIGTLSGEERRLFEEFVAAETLYDFKLDAYWREVTNKRALRKGKKARGEALTAGDYVFEFPPVYQGPALTPALAKRWAAFKEKDGAKKPPPRPLPRVEGFLANAKVQFGFVPERVAEREFKRRYAQEALRLGLTKDQVVRIYALETGGIGTADMQAGIHPLNGKGRPISTALGYAQLLSANSIGELVASGSRFHERLKSLAARSSDPMRAEALTAKAGAVRKMLSFVRSIPNVWAKHVANGNTAKGQGVHALNIDGDIGPWLQVVKLSGLKETAEKAGITRLESAQMELMNLSGPATGLEMMQAVARDVPTPNFFERGGYNRNTIVRGKTASELIAALAKRMDENMKNAGAQEFAAVFDEVIAERQAQR